MPYDPHNPQWHPLFNAFQSSPDDARLMAEQARTDSLFRRLNRQMGGFNEPAPIPNGGALVDPNMAVPLPNTHPGFVPFDEAAGYGASYHDRMRAPQRDPELERLMYELQMTQQARQPMQSVAPPQSPPYPQQQMQPRSSLQQIMQGMIQQPWVQ